MKLSGHNYNNDVFDSLLNGLSDEIILKKKASAEKQTLSGMNVFSSTTEEDFNNIQEEELKFVASELQYAADNAKVAITLDDLKKFASQVTNDGLKGKALERAARRFCTDLDRQVAAPQGTTRRASSLVDQLHGHSVVPAGYNPEHGPGDSKTGGYMGQSKNPNTIFDEDAIQQFAQKVASYEKMSGDEKIAHSKARQEEYRKAMKDEQWQSMQDKCSDPNLRPNKIASIHTGNEVGTSQALPNNSMSIFSNDRDFSNIPDKTAGEMLKTAAAERASKSAASKDDWNQVKPATKANNSLPSFFAGDTQPVNQTTSTQRAAIDTIFEVLVD